MGLLSTKNGVYAFEPGTGSFLKKSFEVLLIIGNFSVNIILGGVHMSDFKFSSLRFENYTSEHETNYSIFLTTDEDGKPEMIWYDEEGDPVVETQITQEEYEKVCSLGTECGVEDWDGFNEIGDGGTDCFSFEAEEPDGSILWAEGTGAFPENFAKFEEGIRSVFSGYIRL